MSELIPLDEAARLLGLSVDRLTEMRSNNEISGVRVGSNWKFKQAELERVADELGIELGSGGGSLEDDDDDFELSDSSGGDSLELLSDSGDDLLLDDSSEGAIGAATGKKGGDANVLDDEDELLFGGSSLKLAAEASRKNKDNDTPKTGDLHDDSDSLIPRDPLESSTGKLLAALEDDDDPLALAPPEDELRLMDHDSSEDSSELGSDFEDSEIVLDDSDSSSELILDSGSQRGMSGKGAGRDKALSASLDAGGSDIDDLELASDDDVLSLGDMADQDSATMMQEDDFNLSPMEESDPDESSGSQVIALEDSDLFNESGVDPLAESGEGLEAPALLDDDGGLDSGFSGDGGFGDELAAGGLAGAGVGAAAMVGKPEVPFTLMQVLSLGLVASILAIGCTLLWDIARNLWMPGDRVLQSGLLKMTLDLLGIS